MNRLMHAAVVGLVAGTVVNAVLKKTDRSLTISIGWPKNR